MKSWPRTEVPGGGAATGVSSCQMVLQLGISGSGDMCVCVVYVCRIEYSHTCQQWYACMHVCMYVCMYVPMYVCIYICIIYVRLETWEILS